MPSRNVCSQTDTSRAGSFNGSGRSSNESTALKIAEFTPIPSASVSSAIAVNAGRFSRLRNPYRRSVKIRSISVSSVLLRSQRLERIDLRRPTRRNPTSQQSNADQHEGDQRERQRIARTDPKQQAFQESRKRKRAKQANDNTHDRE